MRNGVKRNGKNANVDGNGAKNKTNCANRLIDAFPKWRDTARNHQMIYMHIGDPNSGKTHDALQALKEAGSGWYLAPLRLLGI